MSHDAARSALQQRVAAAIVEAAARVLAARGERASMLDVAEAAGVARATVYRYFPTRHALLDELGRATLGDAAARLVAARLDEVPTDEAVRRAARALTEIGDAFVVVARERQRQDHDAFDGAVAAPLRDVVTRGQARGALRDDVPAEWLVETLVGVVVSALTVRPHLGREDTIATVTSLFLQGARAQGDPHG